MTGFRAIHSLLNKMSTASSIQRIFKRNVSTKKLTSGDRSIVVHVRYMLDRDVPQIIEMRRRCKSHDPVSIYSMCMAIDPTSIIVADDGQGKVIGFLSALKDENMCVGGMRTTHEDYRNMGISSKVLFPRGLELAGSRTVLVYSEIDQLLYNKKRLPYLTKNFTMVEFMSKQKIHPDRLSSFVPQGVEIKKFDDSHLVTLLEYDHLTSGYSREALVKFNCLDSHGETLVALRNGKCVGYGTIKLDILGDKMVGPLYADSPEIAEALLRQLLESFKSAEGFHGNALSNNASAMSMFDKLGEMRTIINYMLCNKDKSWPDYRNVYAAFEAELQPI